MHHDNSVKTWRLKIFFGNRYLIVEIFAFLLLGLFTACQVAKHDVSPTDQPITKNENVIRITSGEWSPYDGEDLPHYGCSAWLIEEAFALEGIAVEFGFFSWSRSYQLAKDGSWDGTIEWADTPDHRKYFYLSEENITDQQWVFFHRVDHRFDWKTLDDLDGQVVGVTNEYVYSDAFNDVLQKGTVTFETASSDEANFRKLLARRITIFPMERRVGYTILQKNFSPDEQEQITNHPIPFQTFQPYLLLSKAVPQNEERIRKFDQGWRKLKESGRVDEILDICIP
jgi:polar amino acid transport system substrate-binding protein